MVIVIVLKLCPLAKLFQHRRTEMEKRGGGTKESSFKEAQIPCTAFLHMLTGNSAFLSWKLVFHIPFIVCFV